MDSSFKPGPVHRRSHARIPERIERIHGQNKPTNMWPNDHRDRKNAMEGKLKLATWNANGLAEHSLEVKAFILSQDINLCLKRILLTRATSECQDTLYLFEKLLLSRLLEIIEREKMIPNRQFGFRNRHAIIEQIDKVVRKINTDMDTRRYCTAAFLDVSQAFDKYGRSALQNQKLLSTQFVRNHKIVSSSKKLPG